MKELALHILDIAQNSIVAGATLIRIGITEDMQ
ncbi:MAG: ATP-binding protein, partial [Rikenellaceae bacterium]|nr:ATP-binding protein [Rikenellaceae bacterium]